MAAGGVVMGRRSDSHVIMAARWGVYVRGPRTGIVPFQLCYILFHCLPPGLISVTKDSMKGRDDSLQTCQVAYGAFGNMSNMAPWKDSRHIFLFQQ